MIHSLAKRIASIFVLYGESSEEDADIYTYVCEAIITIVLNVALCVAIAFFFGRIVEGLVFIAVFVLLRRYAGGYHAKTHLNCILTFGIIFTCAIIFTSKIPWHQMGSLVTLVCASVSTAGFFLLAPVEHKSKTSGCEFRGRQRKISLYLISILWLFCVIDLHLLNSQVSFVISLSMLSVFGSMAYAVIYKRVAFREEVTGL